MKILIINGSPRKQGHISKMLQLMETEARANGDEVTVIRVADLQISPCIGCMSCREKLKCCLPEDDAQRVLKQIEEAQALIIGAPCYWVKALKEILKWSGFKVVSASEKGGTKQHPGLTEREMKRCRRVIHKL